MQCWQAILAAPQLGRLVCRHTCVDRCCLLSGCAMPVELEDDWSGSRWELVTPAEGPEYLICPSNLLLMTGCAKDRRSPTTNGVLATLRYADFENLGCSGMKSHCSNRFQSRNRPICKIFKAVFVSSSQKMASKVVKVGFFDFPLGKLSLRLLPPVKMLLLAF